MKLKFCRNSLQFSLLAGFLLSFFFPTPRAEAIVIRHDRDDSLYISLANQPQFAPIGSNNGVLIAPDWVVTAAHVGGAGFSFGGIFYPAIENIPHPLWDGDLGKGYDIQLLKLATPVVGLTPALLYGGKGELGLTGTYLGYGQTGTGLTGGNLPGGTKRAAQNVIDAFGVSAGSPNEIAVSLTDGPILLADFDNPDNPNTNTLGDATPLDLEGSLGTGDSGSGLFVEVNGVWLLAGIHSFIGDVNGDGLSNGYGDWLGVTRVSAHADWIFQTTGIVAVPEPLTLLGAGTAVGFGLFFKKKRGLDPRRKTDEEK
jgi:hypothetical protein